MALVTDALSSLLGTDSGGEPWSKTLRQASFRGVPFAVTAEETSHGRRTAIHEYPYRDTPWIEDLGRGTRKMTIRGFLIQDSVVYGGGSVIQQRLALIAACEQKGAATLIHPTLGEMTVSIPENGLRIGATKDNGRVFEFTLTCVESGLKVFAVTTTSGAASLVNTNYLKLVSTTVLSVIARVKSELRAVTQAIKTIKGIASFWTTMVQSTIDEVTNVSNTLKSTFGNTRYGRYNSGTVGGSAGLNSTTDTNTTDTAAVVKQAIAQAITDRKNIADKTSSLTSSSSIDDYVSGISNVVQSILDSTGGVNDRLRALEQLANAQSTQYQQATADQEVAASINALILFLCSGAMASAAITANPTSKDDADALTERVSSQLGAAILTAGDRGDDDIYQALLSLRESFLTTMAATAGDLVNLVEFSTPTPLPALTIANRLYQDASRADELIASTKTPHPAFMPTKLKVLRK